MPTNNDPPTTDEFNKLIELRRLFQTLAAGGPGFDAASEELLALLPNLRAVFGPAFPREAQENLDAVEADLVAGRARPDEIARRADAVSRSLGISLGR